MTVHLQSLYEQTVLEHGRRPRNRRTIDTGLRSERHNPLCGDRVTVYVQVEDTIIRDASFEASACTITVAAASLMTEAVIGGSVEQAEATAERLRLLLTSSADGSREDLGALTALGGVRQFPMRVKCALLPWQALLAAISKPRRA